MSVMLSQTFSVRVSIVEAAELPRFWVFSPSSTR